MTTADFQPGIDLMNNGIAVRLVSLQETIGCDEYWWVLHLFVAPKNELMAFSKHGAYRKLHSQERSAA